MKNLILVICCLLMTACNPKISINSGKNDSVTEELVVGQGNDAFQVTYEETEQDRLLRYELLKSIREYEAVLPAVDEELITKVTFKEAKDISFFLTDKTECRYQIGSIIIRERILSTDEQTKSYVLEKKATPVMETVLFVSDESLKDLCNADLDQLNILETTTISLLAHILEKKEEAKDKLERFADMCRYGGTFATAGVCLGHSIQVEKTFENDTATYTLKSILEGETNRLSYTWALTTDRPYFSNGFIYNLVGETPDFESFDPHFYQQIEVVK
jgi:hypothetical protein